MARILNVDDSVTIRQMVAFTLTSAGHEVVEAKDGQEGVEKALAGNFQLVITDLHMPKLNGIQFIKELRKSAAHKFTPILMLTTESAAEMKAEGKGAGATGWLVKPFNPDQLVATVARVLG